MSSLGSKTSQKSPEKYTGVNVVALQQWKKKRRIIVETLVEENFHNFEVCQVPTNLVRAHKKLSMKKMTDEEQEQIFFADFIRVCRGSNTPSIQFEFDEDDKDSKFNISDGSGENVNRWLVRIFPMAKNLFELQLCVSRLRADRTRGPIVVTFCSVVLKYLRREFYPALTELENLPCKTLLTLQRKSAYLNSLLEPLKNMAQRIEAEDLVGGELLDFFSRELQEDSHFRVQDVIRDVLNISLRRYNDILYEWISQCTLTFDLAHEFFIWDLSKTSKVARKEFHNYYDGSEFDKRFVVVEELCPESLKLVLEKIMLAAKYLFTMKNEHATSDLLLPQLTLDGKGFADKTMGELKEEIRSVYSNCSVNVMYHLDKQYDIGDFTLRLPNYFLGMNSTWIDELVGLYEEKYSNLSAKQFTRHSLQRLFDEALDNDWLKEDRFRDKFVLEIPDTLEPAESDDNVTPQFELRLCRNPTLFLAFPGKVLEPYQRLFRLSFMLHRARYLLHRKRFFDGENFNPGRTELVSLFLIIRFVHVYHNFIFVTVVDEVSKQFIKKFAEVKNLEDLVEAQFDFIGALLERSQLGFENSKFTGAIHRLVECFISYARNEYTFAEVNEKSIPLIQNVKKMMLKNNEFSVIKNLLFGRNFQAIGPADMEPMWMSLRHEEPMK